MNDDEKSTIEIHIEGDITGDLNVVGEHVEIHIGGSVEGGVTVRQMPLGDPNDLIVEVKGERINPQDPALDDPKEDP